MITFINGPASGTVLELQRAPQLLRVVVDETDGRVDALDQLDDTPGPSERVHVYRRTRYGGQIFACARGRGARSSVIQDADYEHLPDVDGEQLRDTAPWRAWAESEGAQRVGAST